jgi:TfoX/Sxy family transcriptional regulator of competence genes
VSRKPTKGSFPRPDPETREAFESLVSDDPRVVIRPMFGNLGAFVNGNMFAGVFGPNLFVRLPEEERAEAIAEGATEFQPMPGRAMKEYVSLPRGWIGEPGRAGAWIDRSLAWAGQLPAKSPKRRGS